MAVNVQLEKPAGGTFNVPYRPGPYIAKSIEITEAPAGAFGNNMYWYWELYNTGPGGAKDLQKVDAFYSDGSFFPYREMTSTKFGKGKSADKTAKARVRVEALLKREIDDDEPLDGLLDQCIGKWAYLYLVMNGEYLNTQFVEPYKQGMLAPAQVIDEGYDSPSIDSDAPF